MLPWGTRPNAVIEIILGPGVETVSPPSSGQPKCDASSPSPRANGLSHASSALRNAKVSTNPAGVAPLAARSERFTRSALRAMVSGGSSERKCTPSTMASVVTTIERAGIGRDGAEITRNQRVLTGWHGVLLRSLSFRHPEVPSPLRLEG